MERILLFLWFWILNSNFLYPFLPFLRPLAVSKPGSGTDDLLIYPQPVTVKCLQNNYVWTLSPPRCFAVGSKDMSTWVFGAERWANLIYYALGGHKDAIVGCFFEESSLDVGTNCRCCFLFYIDHNPDVDSHWFKFKSRNHSDRLQLNIETLLAFLVTFQSWQHLLICVRFAYLMPLS